MAITNNLKPQLDLPVFEWCRLAPTATAAPSGTCTAEDGSGRYIYYLTGSTFYRYDTYADSWQELATPPVAPVTLLSMEYSPQRGRFAHVISSGATSLTVGGIYGRRLDGATVRVETGTGQGQTRVATFASETIWETGLATTASATTIGDSLKKWKVNQWRGYTCMLTYNAGQIQQRLILYNDTTTLYFSDTNYQVYDPCNNTGFSSQAPQAIPVTTANLQTAFSIVSQTYTVPAWTTNPGIDSKVNFLTGCIYMFSSAAAAPYFTLQVYDIALDAWHSKSCDQGLVGAAIGTDAAIDKLPRLTTPLDTGTCSGTGTARQMLCTGKSWTVDQYAQNFRVYISGGTGIGQSARIACNTSNTIWLAEPMVTATDATSTYEIHPDYNALFMTGGAAAALFQYNKEHDMWVQGPSYDFGVSTNMCIQQGSAGSKPVGITAATYGTNGLLTYVIANAGTGYSVGDILTNGTGGTNGKIVVTGVAANGAITSTSLYQMGTGYSVVSGSALTGGTGSSATMNVSSVAAYTGILTTAINHWFDPGDIITFSGASTSGWNGTYTLVTTPALTTVEIQLSGATSTAAATASQTTSLLVDPTKSWIINEHVGKLLCVRAMGASPTTQIRRITANTATTITCTTLTSAANNGTSSYSIYDSRAFGADQVYLDDARVDEGHATSGSTTTIVDTTKNWYPGQWVGHHVRITAGTGYGTTGASSNSNMGWVAITANDATTLTFSAVTNLTVDATTHYMISSTYGIATSGAAATITDTAKKWPVNYFAAKRIRVTSGTGVGQEATINSNTATAITVSANWGTAPDATSTYCVLGAPAVGAGCNTFHAWNSTLNKAVYKYRIRGGASNVIDRYDLRYNKWTLGYFLSPNQMTLTTGSMYCYDTNDKLYIQKDATGRIYALNIATGLVETVGMVPYGMGTAIIGNRMELIESVDGLKYLYVMRSTGQEMWRMLCFF